MALRPQMGDLKASDILKRTLEVEYRFIFWYPQLEKLMPDKETAQRVKALGQASVRHAETVSRAIASLGEEPTVPTLEALPDPLDLRECFRLQLEYEKLALWLHSKAAELVPPEMASQFRQMAKEEASHITLAEAILGRLEHCSGM